MTEKLKKCPFCGGEAKIKGFFNGGTGNAWEIVRCTKCGIEQPVIKYYSFNEAIAAWNTRVADENPALTLDELKQTEDSPLWIVDKERGIQGHRLCGDCDYPAFNGFFSMGIDGREYIHDYQDYGKTWAAYRRKPEDGEMTDFECTDYYENQDKDAQD